MGSKEKNEKLMAVDIKRSCVVTKVGGGGSIDAEEGAVLLVGTDVSESDAGYLVAAKRAVPCAPSLKAEREKAAKAEKK